MDDGDKLDVVFAIVVVIEQHAILVPNDTTFMGLYLVFNKQLVLFINNNIYHIVANNVRLFACQVRLNFATIGDMLICVF